MKDEQSSAARPYVTRMLNTAGSLAIAHLAGTYVSCLIFSAPVGWAAPMAAWFLTSLTLIPLLLLVSPFAAILLLLLHRSRAKRKRTFAIAGLLAGHLALVTFICFVPKILTELDPVLMVVAASSGGAVGGFLYRLTATLPRRPG